MSAMTFSCTALSVLSSSSHDAKLKPQTSLIPLINYFFCKQGLENSPLEGRKVKLFAALLHTHLAGTDENNKHLVCVKQDPEQNSLTAANIRLAHL